MLANLSPLIHKKIALPLFRLGSYREEYYHVIPGPSGITILIVWSPNKSRMPTNIALLPQLDNIVKSVKVVRLLYQILPFSSLALLALHLNQQLILHPNLLFAILTSPMVPIQYSPRGTLYSHKLYVNKQSQL